MPCCRIVAPANAFSLNIVKKHCNVQEFVILVRFLITNYK